MKLPKSIIKWIKIIYKKTNSRIEVNGTYTELIEILNGVRQGCPLSMLLFGVILEPLVQKILLNEDIKGIKFGEAILKIQICADDMIMFCTSEKGIQEAFTEIQKFFEVSGQKLNFSKTEILVYGHCMKQYCERLGIEDKVKEKITVLGIKYSFEKDTIENWIIIKKKIENIINNQNQRNLTIYGKIQIINTLIIPTIYTTQNL